jgi:hypothetical protein
LHPDGKPKKGAIYRPNAKIPPLQRGEVYLNHTCATAVGGATEPSLQKYKNNKNSYIRQFRDADIQLI